MDELKRKEDSTEKKKKRLVDGKNEGIKKRMKEL